jgi:hypothetical protein
MVHPFLIFGTDYMIFIPRKGLTFVFFLVFLAQTDMHDSVFFNSSYLSLKSFHFEVLIESTSYHHLNVHISYNHLLAK